MAHWEAADAGDRYEKARPQYTDAIFNDVLELLPPDRRRVAVDVACGTGQAVRGWHRAFQAVVGVDRSQSMTDGAFQAPNVSYVVGEAESFALPDTVPSREGPTIAVGSSVDLVSVATALHWFDLPSFLHHAAAVLAPDGGRLLATWCYMRNKLSIPACDAYFNGLWHSLYDEGYWPRNLHHVMTDYAELVAQFAPNGFALVKEARHDITSRVSIDHLVRYVATWSAIKAYGEKHGEDQKRAYLDGVHAALCKHAVESGLASVPDDGNEGLIELDLTVDTRLFVFRSDTTVAEGL